MVKVSVLVPLYNTREDFLRIMIESVLSQTYSDFELILLNDSPWNKEIGKIVSSYEDNRIRYEENEINLGISESRNRLIDMANGEYIAILDHDDVCKKDRLKLQVDFLDNHKEFGVCSGWSEEIPSGRLSKYPEHNREIKTKLLDGCCVLHPAAMLRKEILIQNHIRYEACYSPSEDYMLWIRLMGVTMFYNIQSPILEYRNHIDNTSHRLSESMEDKDLLIKSVALKKYPYYIVENKRKSWIYLFDCFPVIKVKKVSDTKKYLLFGVIPLFSRR